MLKGTCSGVCNIEDVYDLLSMTCEKVKKTLIPNISAFLPTLNILAQTHIVVINITFKVKQNLTTNALVYDTYFTSFNSLVNTSYNPLVTTAYTATEISNGLANIQTLFANLALTFPMFVTPESITYTYTATKPPSCFFKKSSSLQFDEVSTISYKLDPAMAGIQRGT